MATVPQRLECGIDYITIGFVTVMCVILSPLLLLGWVVVKLATWWAMKS